MSVALKNRVFQSILSAICLIGLCGGASQVHAEDVSAYDDLTPEQKLVWRRLLFQEDPLFRPRNPDFYLSNTTRPDLAEEFRLVQQYLYGDRPYSGPPDLAPWCQFPARFFFVADATSGKFLSPEALRPCDLALPAADESLKANLVLVLEPEDTGQALSHVYLLIQGKRFHNASALNLQLEFSMRDYHEGQTEANPIWEAIGLIKAFSSDGVAVVRKDVLADEGTSEKTARESYSLALSPRQVYLLALIGIEASLAKFPYALLRANCHTYIEHLLLVVLPTYPADVSRWFYDYLPEFMTLENPSGTIGQAPSFEPLRYRPSLGRQLESLASALVWDDYQRFQAFLDRGTLPAEPIAQLSRPLQLLLGKAAELFPEKLKKSSELLALRDEYLATSANEIRPALTAPPPPSKNEVPLFDSPHPSAIGVRASTFHGKANLQVELDVFDTRADQLQGTEPYGFVLGKLNLVATKGDLAFDHFLFVRESKVGAPCCGETLYGLGFRKLSSIALDVVNTPQSISPLPDNVFKPQLDLSIVRGIGTIATDGPSLQILPTVHLLTYGRYIDFVIDARLGWQKGAWAVSVTKLARIHDPTERRGQTRESFKIEYQVSKQGRLEFSHGNFGASGSMTGLGFAYAF